MKITKIINNNIVSAADGDGQEIIVMGRGLGFKVKPGERIPKDKIEKIFRMDSPTSASRFKDLIANLPMEHVQISAEIINYAKSVLNKKLNQNIYITLTDHINFAIERYHQAMMYANPLMREIKTFYKEEYLVGEYAIALIERQTGILLPVDEAASIALHLVNAEYNSAMRDTIDLTNLIQGIVMIVEEYFNLKLDETTLNYGRFITHVKFLAQRLLSGELLNSENPEFTRMIEKLYPAEYQCSVKIKYYIKETFHYDVTEEEMSYMAVHIRRIRS